MAIITKSRLNALAESQVGNRQFSQVLNEAKIHFSAYGTNTFLSHSHTDLENGDLNKTIVLLRANGLRLYIDSKDPKMPPITNETTATRIKNAIINNHKFLLLASDNAVESKWCNWELGFGDAKKYINNIALFPLAENSGSWKGSEYLAVYPRMEEINGSIRVVFPNGAVKTISEWLTIR